MSKELTEEEVVFGSLIQNRIVEQQLKRLEADYDLVQQFNVLPTADNLLRNNQLSQILKKQFSDHEINHLITNDISDYQLTKRFDVLSVQNKTQKQQQPNLNTQTKIKVEKQIDKQNQNQEQEQQDQDQVQDNPYQMMGNDQQDNILFSDQQNDNQQNNKQQEPKQQSKNKQKDNQLYFPKDEECQEDKPNEQQKGYKPEQVKIDSEKIMEIAKKMNIQCPDWMNNNQQCQRRLKQLFSKKS